MINELVKLASKPIAKYVGLGVAGIATAVASGFGVKKMNETIKKNKKDRFEKITLEIKNNLLGDYIILDSNIWMIARSEEYLLDFIFRFCADNKKVVSIPSFQLKEFQKPKNDDDRYLKKTAKVRIEKFQDNGLVKIEHHNQKFNYIDDSLLDVILNKKTVYSKISLITEDRELRIKAKALNTGNINSNTIIVASISDLEKYYNDYRVFYKA
ncbi:MAG: PIN domain-containing protein [Psychroflexus sp.]